VPEAIARFLPDKLQAVTVFLALKRFVSLHRKLLGKYTFTMPPQPSTADGMTELRKPLLQFLRVCVA
jgi:hypothetical protein